MLAYLRAQPYESELVVVDDGSSDGTAEVVRQVAAGSPVPVEILRRARNAGKGAALKLGFARARGRSLLFTDADLSVPLEFIEPMRSALEQGADVCIGSRRREGARLLVRQPRLRQALGMVFTALVRLAIGPVTDATCGFKAFRGDVGRDLFARARIPDWSFDAELLFLARRAGHRIEEIPVDWSDRPGSNVRVLKDALRSLRGLATIRWNGLRGTYEETLEAEAPAEVWTEGGA